MKKFTALLLGLAMTLGLWGCAAEDTPYVPTGEALIYSDEDLLVIEQEEENIVQEFSMAYYPDRSMNPFNCTDFTNRALFSLIYQSLFSVNRNYETVPILCDRYEQSADYRVYTIYLANATFSDGSAVTLGDVLASYEAAKESAYYSGRFLHISEISIQGNAIVFTLDTPMEELPMLLDIPIVKASQVDDDSPLGSGPYALSSSLAGAHLRRVINWWCRDTSLAVTADSIPLIEAESPSHIRDQFEFADVGLVCADPCSDLYADYRCDYELWNCENGIFVYLGCNVAYSEVFSDPDIRAALTYAIDREYLVEEFYRGFAKPTALAVSPDSPYYSAGLDAKYEYEPVKFVQAISSLGALSEPIELLVNQEDSSRLRTARAIADMLTECGLETVTVEVNTNVYINRIHAGTFDLYLGQTKLSPNMDLSAFLKPWGSMSYNGMSDAGLYAKCLSALENYGNYYNLHKDLADDGRITALFFCGYAVYTERGLLTDLEPSRDNIFYYDLGRTMDEALIPIDYTTE